MNKLSKKQEFVKKLIDKSDLSRAAFAKRINLTPQNLNYHLNESPELSDELYLIMLKELSKFVEIDKSEAKSYSKIHQSNIQGSSIQYIFDEDVRNDDTKTLEIENDHLKKENEILEKRVEYLEKLVKLLEEKIKA